MRARQVEVRDEVNFYLNGALIASLTVSEITVDWDDERGNEIYASFDSLTGMDLRVRRENVAAIGKSESLINGVWVRTRENNEWAVCLQAIEPKPQTHIVVGYNPDGSVKLISVSEPKDEGK